MALIRNLKFVFLLSLLWVGCKPVQHISKTNVTYEVMDVKAVASPDESISQLIAPYKLTLDEKMNEQVATLSHELTKKKPESTLGNWFTDAMLSGTHRHGFTADFAIANYGGLRVPQITAGPLTIGEIYELCPFDNLVVIVDVPGKELDTLLQKIAASEGWPVSKGVAMVVKDKVMTSCTINNKPIDPQTIYKVAMPDYVANGGDEMKVLIPLSRIQTGIVQRDLLIEEAQMTTKEGKEIKASIEGRIKIQ
jgi:2',3'-cyclic-nucleotide 2'-phosphodiesterase (5'-nucleotidase family)